jgi:3-deoxy-D-manno-octulosonate 8-phosphate phosphatase (KDO 8-P phosphatase)
MKDVKIVILDFDGVLTDNRVYVLQDGREAVVCNRSDGIGAHLIRGLGVEVKIVSTEENPVVSTRGKKIGIEVVQGVVDKGRAVLQILNAAGIAAEYAAFVGNDVNDLPAMKIVGWPIAPADAHQDILSIARHVTRAKGGEGVLREIADLIIEASGIIKI